MASSRQVPQNSSEGVHSRQTRGRDSDPKIMHRKSSVRLTQGTPPGFPSGIPGMGDEIEGAMQQAPQSRQLFFSLLIFSIIEKTIG